MVTFSLLLLSAFKEDKVYDLLPFHFLNLGLKDAMDPTNIAKIKSYQMIMQKKKTPFGIRPMWGVLFLSLILSLFQMIILPSSDEEKRGWDSAHPAFSCKESLDSGNSKGDWEYWINPEKSGNPLRVYCDRSRYGGK